jgi:hypothetical protein
VNRLLLTFLIVFAFSSQVLCQVGSEAQFNFAKTLYDNEEYFDAVTEFQRLLFFDQSGEYSFEGNKLIGLSYKQGGFFSDALRYLTLAEINAVSPEEVYETRIEIIKVNILRRTTEKALTLLDSLESDQRYSDKVNEINYWRGWAHIFSDDWGKATASFGQINPEHELQILADEIDNKLYSETKAKILSICLPGAGQFYTGEYVSGLLSFGWNALWGYLTVQSFIDDRVFDGIMVGSFLWTRFYNGNLQNAEKFAMEKNLEITNEALRYLQNNYTGEKP